MRNRIKVIFICYFGVLGAINCQKPETLSIGVEIKPGLLLDQTEVTNAQYHRFVQWVLDSIAHTYLDHYTQNYAGDEYIDWEYEIDWRDETLEDLFYQGDDRFAYKKELDVSKLVFTFEGYGWKKDDFDNSKFQEDAPTTFKRKINIYPDTLIWILFDEAYLTYAKHYFRHEAFAKYPVVGIDYDQAQAYCYWREKEVGHMLKSQNLKNTTMKIRDCWLPTAEEWRMAAEFPFSKKTTMEIKQGRRHEESLYHFRSTAELVEQQKVKLPFSTYFQLPTPVDKYPPNAFGFYHLWGNVAEMTAMEGVALGGSWLDSRSAINVQTEQPYEGAATWLGFRCICSCEY